MPRTKNNITNLVAAIITVISTSVSQETNTSNNSYSKSIIDSLSLIHPIHIGNIWQYSNSELAGGGPMTYSIFTSKIINDTLINSKRYAVVEDTQNPYYRDVRFVRFDSITANYYEQKSHSSNEVLIDSTLSSTSGTYPWGQLSGIITENIFGKETISRIIVTSENGITYNTHYAFGFGKVHTDYEGMRFHGKSDLSYAKIDGKEFGIYTGVELVTESRPIQYSLLQNYPNPFNPLTTINFHISHFCFVSLRVFDLLGRELVNLMNESKAPGEYSIKFDGTLLPSGIYIYEMKVDKFFDSKQMLLLK